MASLVSATALDASPRIQRLSGARTASGSNPRTRTQPFISAKREAFQTLVAPLRRHRRQEETERVGSERGNSLGKLSSRIRGDLGGLGLVRDRFDALGDEGVGRDAADDVERVHDVAL